MPPPPAGMSVAAHCCAGHRGAGTHHRGRHTPCGAQLWSQEAPTGRIRAGESGRGHRSRWWSSAGEPGGRSGGYLRVLQQNWWVLSGLRDLALSWSVARTLWPKSCRAFAIHPLFSWPSNYCLSVFNYSRWTEHFFIYPIVSLREIKIFYFIYFIIYVNKNKPSSISNIVPLPVFSVAVQIPIRIWILIFFRPGSGIQDPGSKQQQKEEGKNLICSLNFFVALNFTKDLSQLTKNLSIFNPNLFYWTLRTPWVGVGIWKELISHPGSVSRG